MPPTHLSQSSKPPSGRYLSFAEREEIAILRAQGHGVRTIAGQLNRPPCTISRELRRNAARRNGAPEYRATTAQWHADRSARRPKPAKLAINPILRDYVQDRLAGMIATPDGAPVFGPKVVRPARRARQDRDHEELRSAKGQKRRPLQQTAAVNFRYAPLATAGEHGMSARAKVSAVSRPKPVLAPVIRIVLDMIGFLLGVGWGVRRRGLASGVLSGAEGERHSRPTAARSSPPILKFCMTRPRSLI